MCMSMGYWLVYVTGLGSFLFLNHSFNTLSASLLYTCIFMYAEESRYT